MNEGKKKTKGITQIHATSGLGSHSTADYQEPGGNARGRITLYSPSSDIPSQASAAGHSQALVVAQSERLF